MTLVGALMLIFFMMIEAAKPSNWQWMWAGESRTTQVAPQESSKQNVDTRLRRDQLNDVVGDNGPQVSVGDFAQDAQPKQIVLDDETPLYRAQFDGWSKIWSRLEVDQKSLFQRGLRQTRQGTALAEDDITAWHELIEQLDQRWEKYLNNAFLMMARDTGELSDESKRVWLSVLDKMREDWNAQVKPTMILIGTGDGLDVEGAKTVARLTLMLDQIMLNLVRDNSVWRAVERDALFRMFERLQRSSVEQLKADSIGVKGFLQLYEQPKVYRGKLVTVRGIARMAYHERARKNPLGIEGYYVFWIKPNGGPDSPIVIYALELPPGFPEVKDRDVDRGTTVLDEEVEFTGFFFKRWAYRARDGINTAPLVIARAPVWNGEEVRAGQDMPSYLNVLITVLLAAVLGVAIAVAVYFQSRATGTVETHRATFGKSEAKTLKSVDVEPGITEALRGLQTRAPDDST